MRCSVLVPAAIVAVLATGCANTTDAVTAAPAPADALPESPAEVAACVSRFDDNPVYDGSRKTGGDHPVWQRWFAADVDAMQAAVKRVLPGRDVKLHPSWEGESPPGWVVNGWDPVRMRFVALVDPEIADITELSRRTAAAVAAEHQRHPRTASLDAVVLPSCFRLGDLAAVDKTVRAELHPDPPSAGHRCRAHIPMELDSRVHVALTPADRDYGERLQRKHGPLLRVSHGLSCDTSHR